MSIDLLPNLPNKSSGMQNESEMDLLPNFPMRQQQQSMQPQSQEQQPDYNMFQKALISAGNFAKPLNEAIEGSGVPSFIRGAVSGAANIPISIANTPSALYEEFTGNKAPQLPYMDLNKFAPAGNEIVGGAGNLVGSLAVPGASISKAMKYARPNKWMGLFTDLLKGAGIGYATGGENDMRKTSAALGAGFSGVKALTDSNIGHRVVKEAEGLKKTFNDKYKSIWKGAEKSGAGKVDVPKLDTDLIYKNSNKNYHNSLKKFEIDPSLSNAQKAQSDLGKFIAKMEKTDKVSGLTSHQFEVVKAFENAQKKIRGTMFKEFEKIDRPDLWKKYLNTTKEYGEKSHILQNPNVKKALKGKLTAKELAGKLQGKTEKSLDFMKEEGGKYPELGLKKGIAGLGNAAKYIGIGAGGGLAPYYFNKFLHKGGKYE
jgi:hypothetical protein